MLEIRRWARAAAGWGAVILAFGVGTLRGTAVEGPAAAMLDSIWRSVEGRLPKEAPPFLWQRQQTPPLPLTWPPSVAPAENVWVRHAFAYGFDPRVSDGIRVAAPYARLRLDRVGRPVAVERTMRGGELLGIQGVAPTDPPSGAIDPEEIARQDAIALALVAAPAPGSREESALVARYGSWLRRERVIADAVRPEHRPFFDWIEQRRKE